MLACKIHAKEDLRIEPDAMPEVGPGQVLVRLGAGGSAAPICIITTRAETAAS